MSGTCQVVGMSKKGSFDIVYGDGDMYQESDIIHGVLASEMYRRPAKLFHKVCTHTNRRKSPQLFAPSMTLTFHHAQVSCGPFSGSRLCILFRWSVHCHRNNRPCRVCYVGNWSLRGPNDMDSIPNWASQLLCFRATPASVDRTRSRQLRS